MSDAALWVHCTLCVAMRSSSSGLVSTSCGRVVCSADSAPLVYLSKLKEAFKNASWQEKQKDSILEHKNANIARLKKEEREGT